MRITKKSNFSIIRQIGEGAFGLVYECIENVSNEICCVKIEKEEINLLCKEGMLYQYLFKKKAIIPKFHYCGEINIDGDYKFALVTDYCNTDVSFYLDMFKNNIKNSLNLAYQLISVIETIHKQNVLHRDIKPENILILHPETPDFEIKLTDLGLCKNFVDDDGYHIDFRNKLSPIGSLRFCSVNSNKGYELSRRDDIYSLIYVLLFLFDGNVKWQNLENHEIIELKENIVLDKKHPLFFIVKAVLKHLSQLDFTEKPNYKYIKMMLKP